MLYYFFINALNKFFNRIVSRRQFKTKNYILTKDFPLRCIFMKFSGRLPTECGTIIFIKELF